MEIKTLSSASINNKRVLLRLDLNLPIGVYIDKTRLLLHLETIKLLHLKHNKVIIISHLGRPKNMESQYSLEFLSFEISQLTGCHVNFIKSLDF